MVVGKHAGQAPEAPSEMEAAGRRVSPHRIFTTTA
jgi:hypothetical protein